MTKDGTRKEEEMTEEEIQKDESLAGTNEEITKKKLRKS